MLRELVQLLELHGILDSENETHVDDATIGLASRALQQSGALETALQQLCARDVQARTPSMACASRD